MESYKKKLFLPIRSTTRSKKTLKIESPRQKSSIFTSIFGTEYTSKLHLFLFLLYSGTSINTVIPTSFLTIKTAQRQSLFYYREGELHMESDGQSYKKFFEITKETEMRKYRQPKYIHFTTNSVHLYADETEAKQCDKKQEFSLLQKYIYTGTKHTKKLRIFWNKEKGFNYWIIKNKNPLAKTEWYASQLSHKPKNSLYMFNLSDYKYAGRILKTSFCPFNLHLSKMKPISKKSLSFRKKDSIIMKKAEFFQTNLNKDSFSAAVYLTKQSDKENTYASNIHIRYGQLEGIIKDFLAMIDRWREMVNAEPVTNACFDFIENTKGRWLLIGFKIKDIDLELLLQSVSLRKFIRTSTKNPYEVKKVEAQSNEDEVIQNKIKNLKNRLNSIEVKPSEFISIDLDPDYSLYNFYSPSISLPKMAPTYKGIKSPASPLAKLYDATRKKAKEQKKLAVDQQRLLAEYEKKKGIIDSVILEIFYSVAGYDYFTVFKLENKAEVFKEFINNCLKGNLPLSRQGESQMIREIGVNKRNLQDFLICINGVLERYYDEDCRDLIIYRIVDNSGFNN